MIDAVLTYYISMPNEEVKVTVEGGCAAEVALNNVELCTRVSNPVRNAQEALNRSKRKERYFTVDLRTGSEFAATCLLPIDRIQAYFLWSDTAVNKVKAVPLQTFWYFQ